MGRDQHRATPRGSDRGPIRHWCTAYKPGKPGVRGQVDETTVGACAIRPGNRSNQPWSHRPEEAIAIQLVNGAQERPPTCTTVSRNVNRPAVIDLPGILVHRRRHGSAISGDSDREPIRDWCASSSSMVAQSKKRRCK